VLGAIVPKDLGKQTFRQICFARHSLTTCNSHRLGGDVVTVLVGPDATATKFYVHADLATQHSNSSTRL